VSRLSKVARTVENVRHIDIDLIQWCPLCKRPELFAEVKSALVNDWEWDLARRHAAFWGHGCLAILVIETSRGDIGVKVYDSAKDQISSVSWADEDFLVTILEKARDGHECW
jgi:hypothetical protein